MSATPPDQGIQAIIAGVVLGALTWVASRRTESKAKNTPEPQPVHPDQPELPPVPQATGEVMDFMRILQRDNASLRDEVDSLKTDLSGTKRTLNQMKDDLEADKSWKTRFLDALGRWLPRVYHSWGEGGSFPLPEGDDLIVLHEIIPRN